MVTTVTPSIINKGAVSPWLIVFVLRYGFAQHALVTG